MLASAQRIIPIVGVEEGRERLSERYRARG